MPNCFTLTRIGESKPTALQVIDNEMCKYFDAHTDPQYFYKGWYDYIGLLLAIGWDWTKIKHHLEGELLCATNPSAVGWFGDMLDMALWLEANFIPNAWYQYGRTVA